MFQEIVVFDTPTLHSDGERWSHLAAREVTFLHSFAQKHLKLDPAWFQDKPGFPHYDIKSDKKRIIAIRQGAIQVDRKYLRLYCQVRFKINTRYGTDPALIGFFGILGGQPVPACPNCGSESLINYEFDVWCSNPMCKSNISLIQPEIQEWDQILQRRERSLENSHKK